MKIKRKFVKFIGRRESVARIFEYQMCSCYSNTSNLEKFHELADGVTCNFERCLHIFRALISKNSCFLASIVLFSEIVLFLQVTP